MSSPHNKLKLLLAAIDAANEDDPRKVVIDGVERAFEIVYAERMTSRLMALYPQASDLLKIAARAQHLRRWDIAPEDFPTGRHGYNDWRKECRVHHARLAAEMMRQHGYDEASIAHVGTLIRKEQLKKIPRAKRWKMSRRSFSSNTISTSSTPNIRITTTIRSSTSSEKPSAKCLRRATARRSPCPCTRERGSS